MDSKEIKNKVGDVKDEIQKIAQKEIVKAKNEMEKAKTQVEAYIKKNPEKAAIISAGIGAALGATIAVLLGGIGKNGKNVKK